MVWMIFSTRLGCVGMRDEKAVSGFLGAGFDAKYNLAEEGIINAADNNAQTPSDSVGFQRPGGCAGEISHFPGNLLNSAGGLQQRSAGRCGEHGKPWSAKPLFVLRYL
jgi:hypothetical protein